MPCHDIANCLDHRHPAQAESGCKEMASQPVCIAPRVSGCGRAWPPFADTVIVLNGKGAGLEDGQWSWQINASVHHQTHQTLIKLESIQDLQIALKFRLALDSSQSDCSQDTNAPPDQNLESASVPVDDSGRDHGRHA